MDDGYAHITSIDINRPASQALDFLSAPDKLGLWAKGMGETEILAGGLVKGTYPRDGSTVYARIVRDDVGVIFYYLGASPDMLTARIMIRVVAGRDLDNPADTCVVSMIAWRLATMDDARWNALVTVHEEEIGLIKTLIEADAA